MVSQKQHTVEQVFVNRTGDSFSESSKLEVTITTLQRHNIRRGRTLAHQGVPGQVELVRGVHTAGCPEEKARMSTK